MNTPLYLALVANDIDAIINVLDSYPVLNTVLCHTDPLVNQLFGGKITNYLTLACVAADIEIIVELLARGCTAGKGISPWTVCLLYERYDVMLLLGKARL